MKGVNALENVATEIRFGNNIAFAVAGGSLGKNLNHADDLVGRTVAKVKSANAKINATQSSQTPRAKRTISS